MDKYHSGDRGKSELRGWLGVEGVGSGEWGDGEKADS
jgi:hypothetical protein